MSGVLQQTVAPLSPAEFVAYFGKTDWARVAELLATLGQAGEEEGRNGAE